MQDVWQDGAQAEEREGLDLPTLVADDVQLLWSLGIPVYQDGRVEAERVAKAYRDFVYPALTRLRDDNARLKAAAGGEAVLLERSIELLSRVEEAAERLEQREREQAVRSEALAAAEKALLEQRGEVATDLARCQAALADSQALLGQVGRLEALAGEVAAAIEKGRGLLEQVASVSKGVERATKEQERAHRALSLALETEDETRRLAEEASRRLREAIDLVVEQIHSARPAPMSLDTEPQEAAYPSYSFDLGPEAETLEAPQEEASAEYLEQVKRVRFTSEGLLPAARLQLKRRLMDILGTEKVTDAPEGRDLFVSCLAEEEEFVVAVTQEAALEYGVGLEITDERPEPWEPSTVCAQAETEGMEVGDA